MTSAPVKGVGALMNFVGGKNLTQTGGTEQADSFGDVMSRTQSGTRNFETKKQPAEVRTAKETPVAETGRSRNEAVKETKTADTTKTKAGEQTEEMNKAAEEAGNELVKDIAKELNVSEEDVTKAMEELGFSAYALFEPANLTQLVLTLTGNEDVSMLLTDEGLFGKLQELLQLAKDAKGGLMQELNMDPEQMKQMLDELQKSAEKQPVDVETALAQEEAPQITVEVHTGGETVKLATDENGNTVKTLETVSQEDNSKATVVKQPDEKTGGKEEKGHFEGNSESNLGGGNAQMDALLQNKAQIQEMPATQTGVFWSGQTQDIMNQIMDYMKLQLKPDMDQLEMQLHPESLGTVRVQLMNKGGEITAQFQVQNETVKAAMESQLVDLKESLKDQGVKVEAVEVTVESNGFESNLWQGQGREENASSQNGKRTPRRINLNELDALFEERASEEELLAAKMMEMNGNTVDYTA